MLAEWEKSQPGRVASIFGALQNIAPSQLADNNLFDFKNLLLDRSGERAPYLFDDTAEPTKQVDTQTVQFVEIKTGS